MSKQSNALSQLEQVATYVKNLNYENRRLAQALDAKMLPLCKIDTQAIIITEAPAELMISSRTDGNALYSYRKEMEEWARKAGVTVFVLQEGVEVRSGERNVEYLCVDCIAGNLVNTYKCLSCNKEVVTEGDRFCLYCGVKIVWGEYEEEEAGIEPAATEVKVQYSTD